MRASLRPVRGSTESAVSRLRRGLSEAVPPPRTSRMREAGARLVRRPRTVLASRRGATRGRRTASALAAANRFITKARKRTRRR